MADLERPHLLGDFSVETFLAEYWQQKPLFLKRPAAKILAPLLEAIDPAEVVGLGCETFFESRLIQNTGSEKDWQLRHGPFTEEDFHALGEQPWTLHVQGVDKWLAEYYSLLDLCHFLPNWRLDDIMLSASTAEGSAGPHFDHYDVFLLQTAGSKRWLVGDSAEYESDMLPNKDLQLLADFSPAQEYLAEPGDLLYIPPGIGHHGISIDESVTCSIGFRAPSQAQIIDDYLTQRLSELEEDQRFSDPKRAPAEHPALISSADIAKARELLLAGLDQPESFARWLGEYMTGIPQTEEPQGTHPDIEDASELVEALNNCESVCWSEGTRYGYQVRGETLMLFVNGLIYELPIETLEALQALTLQRQVSSSSVSKGLAQQEFADMVIDLFNQGLLYIPES